MYIVFVVSFYDRQWVQNRLGGYGQLEHIQRHYIDGECLEVMQLELTDEDLCRRVVPNLMELTDTWTAHVGLPLTVLETDIPELQRELETPRPQKPSISWCVRRFLWYYPETGQDPGKALGKCGVTSISFLHFLWAYGAISREQLASHTADVVTHYFGDKEYETPDFPREYHSVVKVGRLRFDFTARQFNPDAPVPLVWVSRTEDDNVFPPFTPRQVETSTH